MWAVCVELSGGGHLSVSSAWDSGGAAAAAAAADV